MIDWKAMFGGKSHPQPTPRTDSREKDEAKIKNAAKDFAARFEDVMRDLAKS